MKKTMKFLCMTALVLVGAVMTGCSNDDDSVVDNKKVVTLTTTIGFEETPALTRALTDAGEKTFAVGDKLAVIYKNTSGGTVKAVNETNPEISNGGKSAKFTITASDPDSSQPVAYIYPASIANSDGTVNTGALNTQDGTLATLSDELDCCMASNLSWNGSNLPGATLVNQFAILAITLKNADGSSEITSSIKTLTINGTYTVNRTPAAGPIYVAIQPVSGNITVTATDVYDKTYSKTLENKTYKAGNGYNVSWKMTQN